MVVLVQGLRFTSKVKKNKPPARKLKVLVREGSSVGSKLPFPLREVTLFCITIATNDCLLPHSLPNRLILFNLYIFDKI